MSYELVQTIIFCITPLMCLLLLEMMSSEDDDDDSGSGTLIPATYPI